MEILLKWMIWGYHHFRKHPYDSKEVDNLLQFHCPFGPSFHGTKTTRTLSSPTLIRTCLSSHPMDGEESTTLRVQKKMIISWKDIEMQTCSLTKNQWFFYSYPTKPSDFIAATSFFFPNDLWTSYPSEVFRMTAILHFAQVVLPQKNKRKTFTFQHPTSFLLFSHKKKLTFRFFRCLLDVCVCVVFPAQLFFSEQKTTHSLPPKKKHKNKSSPSTWQCEQGHISPFHPSRYWSS